jgi:transcriptional regulator
MYVPAPYQVDDDVAWSIVATAGAGHLVVATSEGLRQVFVPFVRLAEDRLITHVSRGNAVWRDAQNGDQALAIFNAANSYISPRWYPSRADDAGVVPTWDYAIAEVTGHVSVHDDLEWLRDATRSAVDSFEASAPQPWSVDDSDPSYVERLMKAIVGIELHVTSIKGATKFNQTRPAMDLEFVRRVMHEGTPRQQTLGEAMDSLH